MQFAKQFMMQNLPKCENKITINFDINILRFLKFFCKDMYEVCV